MIAKEKLKLLLDYTDKNGKRIIYKPEEGGKVYIDIDGEVRAIGHILLGENNIIYTKFEDETNIFRKTNAWSINYTILPHVDHIHYDTRTYDYVITKERALEFGQFFHFQDTTELKLYVPLQYWEKRAKGMKEIFPEKFAWYNQIGQEWYDLLEPILTSDLVKGIRQRVQQARQTAKIYPESNRVFRAFKLCTPSHVKVIVVGQDPYHDGTANGLAFGYLDFAKKPYGKSLDIIYKEVQRDLHDNFLLDYDFSLEAWAKQGVFLLNSVLTVQEKRPNSHANIGWERFTKSVLYKLYCDPAPKVFMLWGKIAQEHFDAVLKVYNNPTFEQEVNRLPVNHLILKAKHPAADLYNKDQFGDVAPNYPTTFSGCKHFSQANEFLKQYGRKEIKW